jgi:hypothetical protein
VEFFANRIEALAHVTGGDFEIEQSFDGRAFKLALQDAFLETVRHDFIVAEGTVCCNTNVRRRRASAPVPK